MSKTSAGMPLESHRNLFYTASRIEPRLKVWLQKPLSRPLVSLFWEDIPVFRRNDSLTFGVFWDGLSSIAREYGCKIVPIEDSSRAVVITGAEAYSISLHLVQHAQVPMQRLTGLREMAPVVRNVATMVEQWGDFDHPEYGAGLNFIGGFVYYAKSSMQDMLGNLDKFDEARALARAQDVEVQMRGEFSNVPGDFGSALLSTSVILAGDSHGIHQSERMSRHRRLQASSITD